MNKNFIIKQLRKATFKEPILVEGLPGMGNVGKIAVDFLIESLNAEKIYEINSYSFPHFVFVGENDIVELPNVSIYKKKLKKNDLFLVSGDVQPLSGQSCYAFCERLVELFKKYKGKEIITLGGVGLDEIPQRPRVFCGGSDIKIIKKYRFENMKKGLYKHVGPIFGVTGVLVGISKKEKIPSVMLLAETFAHPTYIGIKGAREILKVLNEKLKLKINISRMDKEIKEIEEEVRKKSAKLLALGERGSKTLGETNYIG